MTSEKDKDIHFKQITLENWLTIDPSWGGVVMSDSRPNPSEAWVADLVAIKLDGVVPAEVRRLFETARSTLIYSLMFYPLLTLGTEQLFRVLETAVAIKCTEIGAAQITRFPQRIERLARDGFIAQADVPRWTAIVHLRNDSSHPRDQTIFSPGMALPILDMAVELIDSLYFR